jgi:hypothetical protein
MQEQVVGRSAGPTSRVRTDQHGTDALAEALLYILESLFTRVIHNLEY